MSRPGDDDFEEKEFVIELQEGPLLEEPLGVDSGSVGSQSLLTDDFSMMASKLSAIESFFKLLTADIRFQDFIRESLLVLLKTVKSEAGSFLEINHQNKTIFFRAAVGHSSDRVVRFVIPLGKGIVGHVAESRQPLVIGDADDSKHLKSIADAVGFDVRNLVALPVVIRGKVFGVIELLNRVGDSTYSEADVELLRSLADMMARAIEVRLMIGYAERKRQKGEKAS